MKRFCPFRSSSRVIMLALLQCALLPLFLISCEHSLDPDFQEYEERDSFATSDKSSYPAAVLGVMTSDIKSALNARFTNLSEAVSEETSILFVHNSSISLYKKAITDVYERNGIVVIIEPTPSVANRFFNDIGLHFELDDNEVANDLYAFSKNHQYILDKSEDEITFNESLNHFILWVNEALSVKLFSPLYPIQGENATYDITKLIEAQTITHSFKYNLEVQEAKALFSKPDIIKGKGVFVAKYSIYPLYVFKTGDNKTTGDIYIVEAEYTAQNGDMCPYENNLLHMWVSKHGGLSCNICGFYLTEYNVETKIVNKDYKEVGSFLVSPVPQTHQNKVTYNSGIDWGFNGSINAGASTKSGFEATGTISGGVTFRNLKEKEISDYNILNNSTDKTIKYSYKVYNLPNHEKGHITDPPAVSVANATLSSSWIWRLDETDNSTNVYKIATDYSIKYGSCHLYTSKADYHNHVNSPEKDKISYTSITSPSRIPTGRLIITNNGYIYDGESVVDNVFISNIIIRDKNNKEVYNSGNGSIGSNPNNDENKFIQYIKTGDAYNIEFKMGQNILDTKTYVNINPVKIELGKDLNLNSVYDFKVK